MRYFYDSHCHMMNLSHPNLTAIIRRLYIDIIKPKLPIIIPVLVLPPVLVAIASKILLLRGYTILYPTSFLEALFILSLITAAILVIVILIFLMPGVRASTISLIKSKLANVMNLLAIMETDIGDCLIQMEEDLRGCVLQDDGFVIAEKNDKKEYDKVVLTPLIMDFGLKEYDGQKKSLKMRFGPILPENEKKSKHPYKVRWKPIVAQVEDLCTGIRDYYRHRDKYIKDYDKPLFQIIPFMGINTQNYSMRMHGDGDGVSVKLENIMERNFGEFGKDTSPQRRRENLDAVDWLNFNGDIESIKSYYFLGVKVYPPLGFDPWPEEGFEREKVCYLYKFCVDHNIPITAHCNPGGFLVDNDFKDYSSPYKWEAVLNNYKNLRLNLAHFGGAGDSEWRRKIVDMILERDPQNNANYKYDNLYTDISYQGVDKKSYEDLKRFLNRYDSEQRRRLIERLIFGTDFMINLQDISSYSTYLDYFFKTDALTLEEKDMLCNKNAERFLYIG